MALILRRTLSRPLTHDELDSNLVYLDVNEWKCQSYEKGMWIYFKGENDDVTSLYVCEVKHTKSIYPNCQFQATINGQLIWRIFIGGDTSTFINPNPTTANLGPPYGGIPAGSTFPEPGKTMQEMWDMLLYPYIASWGVTPPTRQVGCGAGTTTFSIGFSSTWTGTTNWRVELSSSWSTLTSASTGTGNATITISYLSNCEPNRSVREATITVYLQQSATDFRSVKIIQAASTYPPPSISFDINSPYLVEVGTTIPSKTGTWSTTNGSSIVANSISISGPQLTTISGLGNSGSQTMTFTSPLVLTTRGSIGPWTAQGLSVLLSGGTNVVFSDTSQSIIWDLKIRWGISTEESLDETDILNFSDYVYSSQYAAGMPVVSEDPTDLAFFYLCVPESITYNSLNWLDDRDLVGYPIDIYKGYANKYTSSKGFYISYDLVNVTINGNIYSYKVYRSANNFGSRVSALLYLE